VAGDVQQQQVRRPPVAEELLDLAAQLLGRPVDQLADLEAADRLVAEHAGERRYVASRRTQGGQSRIAVGRGGDEERLAAPRGSLIRHHGVPTRP
jgi:hypothetical protein